MKRFLFKIIVFSLISVIFLLCFHFVLTRSRNKILLLPNDISTLYVGNSTVECSINDNFFEKAFNGARSAEPINYTYAKIKLFKKINPQIDTIIMSFDDIILFKEELNYPSRPILYFIDQFDVKDCITNIKYLGFEKNSGSFSHLYDIGVIRPMIESYFHKVDLKRLDIAGYLKLDRDNLQKDIEKRKHKVHNTTTLADWSGYNKYYMDRIADFCNKNNIILILLSCPKHKEEWQDTTYREIHRKYYSNFELKDYLTFPLSDSCFADCRHLNYKGAELFTKKIKKDLKIYDSK